MGVYSVVRNLLLRRGASLFLLLVAVVKVLREIVRYRRFFKFYNDLPGETDFHWFWGNIHKLHDKTSEERLHYGKSIVQRYPRISRFWAGPFRPIVYLHHPDTIKKILKGSDPKPLNGAYRFGIPWLGEGLLIASGERWARSRSLLSPAFHFDTLKPYTNVFNRAADVLLELTHALHDEWQQIPQQRIRRLIANMRRRVENVIQVRGGYTRALFGQSLWTLLSKIGHYADSGESFEVYSHISLCTLEVILKCAMSHEDDVQMKGDTHPYMVAVNELSEVWYERTRDPFMYSDAVFYRTKKGRRFKKNCDFVHSVSEEIIEKRKHTLEKEGTFGKKTMDFLDILLTARDESGKGLTPLEIRNEVDTFLFEGHDTTASTISWIMFSLAKHGDIQDTVQAEVDAILDGRDPEVVEWNDLSNLSYLGYVIKEGMRLHCPVPIMQRQLLKDTTIAKGVTLPKDTICMLHLLNLHHNSDVWEDPWEFRPERFYPENMREKDTYAFVPFSAGPRNCIGQHFAMNEVKVLLMRILHKYQLQLDLAYPVTRKMAVVMRPENGIRMFAKRRKGK